MYRKKGRGWTKHADFMLIDVLCMQLAFIVSYIVRFGISNPYTDSDYRILAIAFLFIDFFVEIVSDSFKNVLKRGYFDELTATCKHTYKLDELLAAHKEAAERGIKSTAASCMLMKELGKTTYFSKGSEENLKITTTDDLKIFKALLHTRQDDWIK